MSVDFLQILGYILRKSVNNFIILFKIIRGDIMREQSKKIICLFVFIIILMANFLDCNLYKIIAKQSSSDLWLLIVDEENALWKVKLDGTGWTKLFDRIGDSTCVAGYIRTSGDGKKILASCASTENSLNTLWFVDLETKKQTKLAECSDSWIWNGDISKNGKKIIYSIMTDKFESAYIMDSDGQNKQLLGSDLGSEYSYCPAFSWDGNKVVFTYYNQSSLNSYYSLCIADSNSINLKSEELLKGSLIQNPCFYPDDKLILYSKKEYSKTYNLYKLNIQTKTEEKIIDSQGGSIWSSRCSPDGTKIVFSWKQKNDKNTALWFSDLNGRNLRKLTDPREADSLDLSISPNSEYIIYESYSEEQGRLEYLTKFNDTSIKTLEDVLDRKIRCANWLPLLPLSENYYVEVVSNFLKIREKPEINPLNLLKQVPKGWILKVLTTTTAIDDGNYIWYEVLDETDNTQGWAAYKSIKDNEIYLKGSKGDENQEKYKDKIAPINDPGKRKEYVRELVRSLWGDVGKIGEITKDLDKDIILPIDLVLAIISEETPSDFDNEYISYDCGRGIMQITTNGCVGVGSNLAIYYSGKKFLSYEYVKVGGLETDYWQIRDGEHGQKKIGPYFKYWWNAKSKHNYEEWWYWGGKIVEKADGEYEGVGTCKYNKKGDRGMKYYTNTKLGIEANIRDGLKVLLEKYTYRVRKNYEDNKGKTIYKFKEIEISAQDMAWISVTQRYNGFNRDKEGKIKFQPTEYLSNIADRLKDIKDGKGYFTVEDINLSESMYKKLMVAYNNSTSVKIWSPVNLQIEDFNGKITGISNENNVIEQIPNSIYDVETKSAIIFFPSNNFLLRIIGSENGSYGLSLHNSSNENKNLFDMKVIPISKNEIHEYKPSWNIDGTIKTLSISKDFNGDGKFDSSIISPGQPSNLNVTTNEDSITLKWNSSKSGTYPIAGYAIYRIIKDEEPFKIGITQPDVTYFVDSNVKPNENYTYFVKAFDASKPLNYSPSSNLISTMIVRKNLITIILKVGDPYMTVNGTKKEIDPGRGTKPVIIKEWGRTLLPIRAIIETLSGKVNWDSVNSKVSISLKSTNIELWINKPMATVNGTLKWIDDSNHNVTPLIINGRTFVPIRFVAENLGCSVDWEPETMIITIEYAK